MPGEPFPQGDQELRAWLNDVFLPNVGAVLLSLGLAATLDDDLVTKTGTYTTKLTTHEASQAQAREDRQDKDDSRGLVITALRLLLGILNAQAGFTNEMRQNLGLPPRDFEPTAIIPGEEVPTVAVDTGAPQHHTVRFWQATEGGGEAEAKPDWARGCRIIRAVVASGGTCPPIENMVWLASDSNSPYDYDLPGGDVGKDIWYRGAWETPRGEIGNWSDPAKGTVTG